MHNATLGTLAIALAASSHAYAAIEYPAQYQESDEFVSAVISTRFYDVTRLLNDGSMMVKAERFQAENYADPQRSDTLVLACDKAPQTLVLQLIQPFITNPLGIRIYHGDSPIDAQGPFAYDPNNHILQQEASKSDANYRSTIQFFENVRHGSSWWVGPIAMTYTDKNDYIGQVMKQCGITPSPPSVPTYTTTPSPHAMQLLMDRGQMGSNPR